MGFVRTVLAASLAGVVSGILFLGVGLRLALAGLALGVGLSTNLSTRGMIEAVLAGAFLGWVGGLVLALLGWLRGTVDRTTGGIAGLVTFGSMFVFFLGIGRTDFSQPISFVSFSVIAIAFLAYGIGASVLLRRFRNRAADGDPAGDG